MPLEAAIAYGAADAVMPYGAAISITPKGGGEAVPGQPEAAAVEAPRVRPFEVLPEAPRVQQTPPAPSGTAVAEAAAPRPAEIPAGPPPVQAVDGTPGSFRMLTARLKRGLTAEPAPAPVPPPPAAVAVLVATPPDVGSPAPGVPPGPPFAPVIAAEAATVPADPPAELEVVEPLAAPDPVADPSPVVEAEPEPEVEFEAAAVPVPDVPQTAPERPVMGQPAVVPVLVPAAPPAPAAASAPFTAAGEAAAALLDIMRGALDLPPQERALAGDTLLLLLPGLGDRDVLLLAERVSGMDQPPPQLLSRLIRDPRPEVSGIVLERSLKLSDEDVVAVAGWADAARLRLVARRRSVPPLLSAHLVAAGDLLSLLALLRNGGAEFTFASFLRLTQLAAEHPSLRAPLALRPDLPIAVALELFWGLPPELRRVILSRYLSDSVTLGRILQVASGAGPADPAAAMAALEAALQPLFRGNRQGAAERLGELAGVAPETVLRIFGDEHGEALVALLKALGLNRSRFESVLDRLRAGTGLLRGNRPSDELKAVFDGLSFNKARVLLVYWDWFTRRAGPYAPAA